MQVPSLLFRRLLGLEGFAGMAYGSLALQAFAFDGKFLELPEAVRLKFKHMDFDNAAIWRALFENAPLTAGAREEYNSLLAELDVLGDDRDELFPKGGDE